MLAVGSIPDLGQCLAGAGLNRSGQAAEHVGGLVDPVALVAGGREDVAEGRPQPQRAVADRDHRCLHAAAPQVAQDLSPAVGGLPLAVSHGDQLLGAVDAHAHDHQAAQPGLLQPHPEVVGSGRGAVPSSRTVRFPVPRRRTGRASCPASGSPRARVIGRL